MKRLLTILLILLVSYSQVNGQSTRQKFNRAIEKHFRYIDSVRRVDPDLMETENKKLQQTLIKYKQTIFNTPDTLDFDWLYVVKSADKKICIVSWDTRMGGTMIEYEAMVLYKDSAGQIRTKVIFDYSNDNATMHYDTIYTLKNNGRTVYLANGYGQGSTALPWQELRAFEIKNGKLINPKIFSGRESNLFVEFDNHEFNDEERIPTIRVRNNSKTILVPIPTEKEGFSGKYRTYILQGQIYK